MTVQTIVSGDSVEFRRSFGSYPATTWTATMTAINEFQKFEIVATADGDDHVFSATAAESAQYVDGEYQTVITVTDGADRYTIETARLQVIADLTAVPTLDVRTRWQKTLDALETAFAEMNAGQMRTVWVQHNQRSVRYNKEELIMAIRFAQSQVAKEKRQAQAQLGRNSNTIAVYT